MHSTPQPRHRRATCNDDSHAPLSRLRRRFTFGAWTSAAVFTVAFVTDLVRHTPGDNMVVSGVESATASFGAVCGLVAALTWIITEHVGYLASLWTMIERLHATGMRGPGESLRLVSGDRDGRSAAEVANPIPIQRGHDMKRQREDRHAV